ncbi:MAG: CoA transferase, partial [Chloroflexota bacterium]|nr:CoA transferase [Chloroflexota bacterium]
IVPPVNSDLWPSFCQALGTPELIDDPRFDPRLASHEERLKHTNEMVPIIDAAFQKKTSKEWLEIMRSTNTAASCISTYEDVVNDPQAWDNGYIFEMDVPGFGPTKAVGAPAMLSESPAEPKGPPPYLGQHTEEVLLELGYTWDDIIKMGDEEVI